MKPSVRLEQESELARTRVAETLDELRYRATPGQLVDQLLDYAREGSGAEYLRNLRREIVDHPLPATLIGTGIAWMVVQSLVPRAPNGATRYGTSGTGRELAESTSATAQELSASGRSAVAAATDRIREASDKVRQTSSSAVEQLRGASARASDAIGQAKESATSTLRTLRDRTSGAYGTAASTIKDSSSAIVQGSQYAVEFSKEQPLVLAGLGIAVGAVIGALLPPTETEDRLMGETADDAKESARRVADRAKEKTMGVYEEVKSSVQQTGASGSMQTAGSNDMREQGGVSGPAPTLTGDESGFAEGSSRRADTPINRSMQDSASVQQGGQPIAGDRTAIERGREPSMSSPHTDEKWKP